MNVQVWHVTLPSATVKHSLSIAQYTLIVVCCVASYRLSLSETSSPSSSSSAVTETHTHHSHTLTTITTTDDQEISAGECLLQRCFSLSLSLSPPPTPHPLLSLFCAHSLTHSLIDTHTHTHTIVIKHMQASCSR